MRILSLSIALSLSLSSLGYASEQRHFNDATIHAIQFVDKSEGWAVGDEGVIWHTIDGGKNWERQPTGVRASLRSVHFLTPYTGWVVGRVELPYDAGSRGVVLFTNDGGIKWKQLHINSFPGLNAVRMVDDRVGYLLGDGSERFPSGIFRTDDGGQTWRPVPGPRSAGWLAGQFTDKETGALVGRWSQLATIRRGLVGAADVDELGGRSLCGLHVQGKDAIAVGQGGLVLLSDTGGSRWGYADLKLPENWRTNLDFHAVHGHGRHLWIAGRPGSVLFHSSDFGRTWQVRKTGQPLPLHCIYFHDEKTGWAAGAMGVILATRDGGQTWQVQRRGGMKAALLFVHAKPETAPLETVAHLGGDQGYLAVGLCMHAPDPSSARLDQARAGERWSAAFVASGATTAEMLWQFPLPLYLEKSDKSTLMRAWDRSHADRAAEEYLRQIVLALRMWQPSVIVTDHPDPAQSRSSTAALVAEALHSAFSKAADPNVFPEQIDGLQLPLCKPTKLYGLWHQADGAHVSLDPEQISLRLGATYRDYTAEAFSLSGGSVPKRIRYFRLLDSRLAGADKHRDLMEGTRLAPGGTARRDIAPLTELSQGIAKSIRQRRNLQALADHPVAQLADPQKMLAQLGPAFEQLPDQQASEAAFAIGKRYVELGQWTLAREVFLLLVDKYPGHPRAADAYRWLVRYNSSSEARRRHELGQFVMVTNFGFRSKEPTRITTNQLKIESKGGVAEGVGVQQLTLLGNRAETRRWYEGCLEIGARLAAFGPLEAGDPSIHFCMNAARRHLGKFEEAREWNARFMKEYRGPWRAAARAEEWLRQRHGRPPKPVAFCRQTATRPFLDGKFDDPCWKDLPAIEFRHAAGATPDKYRTDAWLAYDDDFLYLALRCQHPAQAFVPPVKPRQHDQDLSDFDRVSFFIDVDRDYSTYFHLAVDQRGCVFEDCWGDRNWNPRWFVAVDSQPGRWQIEAAIPLVSLTGDKITIGKAWCCNLVRIVPRHGVQAMSLPADVEPRPEGMGLLLFAPGGAKRGHPLSAKE
ncbi:MAG: hypothetical protein KatS3mg105_4103 [Gemmatales bacterium]|nr:MAG: hypothetical protein KatS3mg105_4103 [Gemmatales bacterium]